MNELPELPLCIPTLSNDDAQRLDAEYPGIPTPPNGCITCGGKGTFRWYIGDTDEVGDYACNCADQWVLHRYMLHCGIGTAYQRLGWRDVQVEPEAMQIVATYLENADAYTNAGLNLFLRGTMGNGKTLLSVLLLKTMLARGVEGYFTTFSGMISKLMASWNDPELAKWFYKRIKNAKLLAIDDVGREQHQKRMVKDEGLKSFSTSTAEFAFEDIIRHRTGMALPSIITSNLSIEQLGQHYGPNLISLIQERSTGREMNGPDFRTQARQRLHEEANAGLTRPVVLG